MANEQTAAQTAPAVYVCYVNGCGRRGPADRMYHVQEFGQPSADADGKIRNVVCASCGQDAKKYGGDRLAVHPIAETLRILAANARRRAEEAAAEAAREQAAREFFGKLGGNNVQTVEEPEAARQQAAKARRTEKRIRRDDRSQEWEDRRNGAAHGYLVTVG